MKRRDLLGATGIAASAGLVLSAPAIAQNTRHLRMVTDWPEGPGLLESARRLARSITSASAGRIEIEVTASGEVVRPFETFDAVSAGVADLFHSHIGYFEDKSPAFLFFSGVPFGMTVNELSAWVRFGGGQQLWDEICAPLGVKPLLCCTTGPQMGGWFLNEITSADSLRGLRYRMAGPGAEVFRRLGAAVVLLPAADIVPSLRSGAIDACEWVGPWLDMAMGLHEVAPYYYYPGWHEPGGGLTLGISSATWNELDEADRQLFEAAAAAEFAVSLAEFNARNAAALAELRAQGTVEIRRFDADLLATFAALSEEVVALRAEGDELTRQAYRSYTQFGALIKDWTDTVEGAYLSARAQGS